MMRHEDFEDVLQELWKSPRPAVMVSEFAHEGEGDCWTAATPRSVEEFANRLRPSNICILTDQGFSYYFPMMLISVKQWPTLVDELTSQIASRGYQPTDFVRSVVSRLRTWTDEVEGLGELLDVLDP